MTASQCAYNICRIDFIINRNSQIIQNTNKEEKRTIARQENIKLSLERVKLNNMIKKYFTKKEV